MGTGSCIISGYYLTMEARLVVLLHILHFLAVVRGFSPVAVHKTHRSIKSPDLHITQLSKGEVDTRDDVKRKDFLVLIGSILTSSVISGGAPAMAEEITTFDLSLPSYDSINTLKITEESKKALGVETPTEKRTATASNTKKTKQKRDDQSTGNPMASVLPSMNKNVGKKSKPQKTVKASKPEKEQNLKVESVDMTFPSYSTNTKPEEKNVFSIQRY